MSKSISYPSIPLHGLLQENADRHPQKVAITFGGQEITYAKLEALTNQFANALISLGVKKGDCVAVFLPNIPQLVVAFFGALKVGAAVTAISPLYREREVEYQLNDSGAQTVVALDSLYPVLSKVRAKTPLKNVIVTGLDGFDPQLADSVDKAGTVAFGSLIAKAESSRPNLQLDPLEDLAALQYTGGTTGTPKAAMLTHRNLVSNALAFASHIHGATQDTFLTALPLSHIYGLTTSMTVPISLGAKMILLPKFEPAKVLEAIQRQKVTVFCGVPTMYSMLLANPELGKYDLTSIRVCISGASSLPPQVQNQFMKVTGGFLAEGYGLTEASPVTHCTPVNRNMVRVGSIGVPLADTEACILDLETGQPLPQGETGELAVRGPQVMKGYWHKPDETAMVLRDGWLLTGDIARVDSDGYFYIVDRKKDLIKHKGYSIYPRELEDILYEHPSVKLCTVIGRPAGLGEEVPVVFVVLKDGSLVTAEELRAFVNGKVAAYKAIRKVNFVKDLPLSAAGKVLKRALRKQA